MKTLKELEEIRSRKKRELNPDAGLPEGGHTRIVVGLATCGIAAGARPVMDAFSKEVAARGLTNVKVRQTGCIGICKLEPIVDVIRPGEPKVSYVRVTPDKVAKIVSEHVVAGRPVAEYMLSENT